jgi:RNA polymerase sigma-70 factor (ECF subfamily)
MAQEEAFSQLVEAHQTSLLRMCYLHLQDRQDAEDAVQETFIKAYRSMAAFRGESSEKTWLMRIAINVCRDMRRSNWFKYISRHVTPELLPEEGTVITEDTLMLNMCIMAMPAKWREVVLLYYYQGLTMTQTAQALGLAQSTVSSRLKQARACLREHLKGGYFDE